MAVKKKSEKRIKKENYWFRLQDVAQKYKNAVFVDADNVSSKQVADIRSKLRAIDAYMIMGKNVSTRSFLLLSRTQSISRFPSMHFSGCLQGSF